jgi:hypothetical protein
MFDLYVRPMRGIPNPLSTAIEESAVAGETEVVVDVLRLLSPEEEAEPAA